MYKTIFKAFGLIFLVSLLMLLAFPYINRKVQYITLFSFIGYFYLTLFFIRIFRKKLSVIKIVLIIFATMIPLQIHTIFTFLIGDPYALPGVIAYFLGIVSAYFYYSGKSPRNILAFSLSSCFIVFMFFQGWDFWLNKINYGNFTSELPATALPAKFDSFDEQKNIITDESFKNKIVLLDFWTTTCGVCFQKFPQVQAIQEKYKNDDSLMILAVNSPIEEDKPNQAFNDIRKEGYDFPVVITKDEDLAEKFGVKGYPTTFVINQNTQIIYKGDIEGAVKLVDELKSGSR